MQNGKMMRVTSSPHIRQAHSTQSIMMDVIIALAPAGIFGVIYFGWRAAMLILVAAASAAGWEFLYNRLAHKKQTVSDLSCVVTGMLLAYNLPASAPWWMAVVGSGLAIMLVKMIFGGIGHNFVNPALTARAILMTSWVDHMSGAAFSVPIRGIDAVTGATPLVENYDMLRMLIGQIPGCIGEVSKVAILVGAVYLIIRKVISWRIPVIMLGTVFILSWITDGTLDKAAYQLLSGGLMLGACFMATDYTTSPATSVGQCIFAVGCGLMVYIIRRFSPMAEGVSYSILFMNLIVPLIDKFVRPKVYGRAKANA